MKKIVSIVFLVVLISMFCVSTVMATTSFTVNLSADKTTVGRGGTVTITVAVDNFTAGEKGINAIIGILKYDKNVFEKVTGSDIKAQGNWSSVTYNDEEGNAEEGKFVTENSEFISDRQDVFTVTLKAKTTAALADTTITVRDVQASDSETDIYPADQTITVKITEAASGGNNTGNNTTIITPTNNTTVIKNTNASTDIPKTGLEDYVLPVIIIVAALALVSYIGYKRIDK